MLCAASALPLPPLLTSCTRRRLQARRGPRPVRRKGGVLSRPFAGQSRRGARRQDCVRSARRLGCRRLQGQARGVRAALPRRDARAAAGQAPPAGGGLRCELPRPELVQLRQLRVRRFQRAARQGVPESGVRANAATLRQDRGARGCSYGYRNANDAVAWSVKR